MGKYELKCILVRNGFACVHSLLHYLPFVIKKKTNKNAEKPVKKNQSPGIYIVLCNHFRKHRYRIEGPVVQLKGVKFHALWTNGNQTLY